MKLKRTRSSVNEAGSAPKKKKMKSWNPFRLLFKQPAGSRPSTPSPQTPRDAPPKHRLVSSRTTSKRSSRNSTATTLRLDRNMVDTANFRGVQVFTTSKAFKVALGASRKSLHTWCSRGDEIVDTPYIRDIVNINNNLKLNKTRNLRKQGGQRYWLTADAQAFAAGWILRHPGLRKRILYIDLVCANKKVPGNGKRLMSAIIEYGKAQKLDALWLSALPHVTGFYKKFGFRFGPFCGSTPTFQNNSPILRAVPSEFALNTAHWKIARDTYRNRNGTSALPPSQGPFYQVKYLGGITNSRKPEEGMHWDGPVDGYLMSLCVRQ